MIINRSLSARHCLLLVVISCFIPTKIAYSANISSDTNLSALLTGDTANFTANNVNLTVDTSRSLTGINTGNTGNGIIFNSVNTLTISSTTGIGSSGSKINQIAFGNNDGTLNTLGSIYANSVTNTTTNTGTIKLDGTALQTIDAAIGTTLNRLKKIEANNASAGMNFIQDFYVKDFSATGVSNIASGKIGYISGDVTGQGKIQSIAGVNGKLVFDGAVAATSQNISSQIGANGNRLNLETKNVSGVNFTKDSYINDLTLTSGVANINSSSSMNIAGGISGSAVIQSSDQTGNITFSGSGAQTVDSQIGAVSNKLASLTINNSNNGVTFNKDVSVSNILASSNNLGKITFGGTVAQSIAGTIGSSATRFNNITVNNSNGVTFNDNFFVTDFTSTSGDSIIASGKTANISGAISGTGILKGTGNLILDGISSQTTSSNIGTVANKFGTITINNTDSNIGAAFSGNVYSSNFVANGKTTINGTGTIDIGATTVNNGTLLTFNNSGTVTSLLTSANGILSIADSKTLNISGNVSGTGKIQSVSSLGGAINFSGTGTQTVASNIGIITNKINSITVGASNQDISFAGDIYATSTTSAGKLIFNGSTSGQTIDSIINANNLSITNTSSAGVTFKQNVATTTGNIVIDGSVTALAGITSTSGNITTTSNNGLLTLAGTSNQTLNLTIGTSANKLNTITTSNAAGVNFQKDIYTNNFNISSGTATIENSSILTTTNLTIGSSAILDVKTANLNISGNTTAITAGASTGKLQSSTNNGNITFNGTTGAQNIAFQIGDTTNRLNIITADNISGVNFTNDIYANGLVVNKTLAASGKVDLVNHITTLNDGTGDLILNGTADQTINVKIGADNNVIPVVKQLNSITITNNSTAGVTFGEDVYTKGLAINGGNLAVKKSLTIGTGGITTSVNNTGKITFSGATAQTITATITEDSKRLNNITVNNSNGVAFNQNFFTNDFAATSGTSTIAASKIGYVSGNITGTGSIVGNGTIGVNASNLIFDGSSTQTIGATTLNVPIINIQNTTSGGVIFDGTNITGNISGSANEANNISFKNSSVINASIGSSTTRFKSINAIAGTSTFRGDLYTKDFSVTSGAIANINNSKTAYIYGGASGSGTLQSSDQTGNVIIGSATSLTSQSVDLALGTSANRLNSIDIANINGASFNQNAFTKNFSDSSAGLITINSSKTISVSEVVANTDKLKGAGTLALDGTSAQSIGSQIGVSNADKLGALKIANSSIAGVTISGSNIYATNLVIDGKLTTSSDLNVNSITTSITTGSLTLNKTFTVAGTEQIITPIVTTSANRLGALIVNSGTVANFSDNIFVKDVTATGTINLASSKTADVSGNISSTGTLQSLVSVITAGNGGYLTLSGTTTQTIDAKIGVLGNELNTITANNLAIANFTNDIFTNNITATGTGTMTLASGKTANVSGNITGTGSLKGVTDGVGDLSLKGTTQTISALIGASGNKLNKITVQGTSTSSFNSTAYTNDFDNLGTTIIGTSGDVHVAGTISGAGALKGINNTSGTLTLDGSLVQSISSQIGVDNSNKLGNLKITNTTGVTLSTSNLFVNNLIIDGKLTSSVDLNVNLITSSNNAGTLILNKGSVQTLASAISASSLATRLGMLTINNSTTANFSDNIAVKNVSIASATDSLNLAANKTASISGDLAGSGVLKGTATSNVTFDGGTPQTVALQIGQDSSNKIGTLTIGTNADVTDTFDINSTNLALVGSLTTSGALNVNNITNGGSATPVGSLTLNKAGTQIITPVIASSTNRLGTLAVSAATTGNFSDNAFVKDITAGGTLNIASAKTFDVSGNINGTGVLRGNGSGIIGNLIFSGATTQTVTAKIGVDTNDKLSQITIGTASNASSVLTNNDIYASSIVSGNAGSSLTLNKAGTQTIDAAIATTSNRLGSLTVNSGATGNFTQDIYVKNINDSGTINIASGKIIDISGNIAGSGLATLKSSNTTGIGGALFFKGTGTQTISSNVTIGNAAYIGRMSEIKNSNNSSEVVFNNSAYTQNFLGTGSEITNINGASNIFVAGNISSTNKIRGSGTLTLDGSAANSGPTFAAQTITSQIGGSNTDRLGTVKIDNSLGATFSGNVYAGNFNIVDGTTIIGGTGTVNIGNIDITAGKKLTLNNATSLSGNITGTGGSAGQINGTGILSLDGTAAQNVALAVGISTSDRLGGIVANNSAALSTLTRDLFLTNLTINGNLAISGQIDVTNNITGTGNLTLNGSSAQTINSQISSAGSRLNSLTIANSSGVSLNQNTYVKDLTLSSGTATIAAAKTIHISGNITGGSQLSGASGSVNLDGSTVQNISSKMGASGNKIDTLIITNTSGTTFSDDIYTNNLTVNGKMTVNGGTTDLGAVINNGELAFNNNASASNFTNNSGAATTINSGKIVTTGITSINGGSTLNIGITDSTYGRLNSGATTVANGTNINFIYSSSSQVILNSATPYTFLTSTGLTVSTANLVLSDNSYLVLSDNSYLTKPVVTKNGNNLEMVATMDAVAISALSNGGSTIVNNIVSTSSSSNDMLLLQSELLRISEKSDVESALSSLTETRSNMNQRVANNISNKIGDIINSRLFDLNTVTTGFSSGNSGAKDSKGWGQAFAGVANQDSSGEKEGFKSNVSGAIVGYDYTVKNDDTNSVIGIAFGYSNAGVDSNGSTSARSTSINSYQVALYNNNSAKTGLGFYNENIANLTINDYESNRTIKVGSFNRNAKSNYGGNGYSLKTGIGYNFNVSNAFLLAPNIALRYFKLNQDSYQEIGAGDVGLKVSANSFETLASEIGVRVITKKINLDEYDVGNTPLDQYNILPEFKLAWLHNLKKDGQSYSTQFIGGGDIIKTDGFDLPSNIYNIGIELNFAHKEDDSVLSFKYDLETGQGYMGHIGSVKYRMPF